MTFETASYAAVGVAVVAACGHFFINWLKRQSQKNDAEKDIDDRVVGIATMQTKIIDEEREEKRRLQDELSKANQRYADAVGGEMLRQKEAIDGVRHDYREGMQRLHARLDECEQHRAGCEQRVEHLEQRVAEIETKKVAA